jgi:mRNA-degrading endonuclease RelE of RelBE toxin-antitoxin system
VFQIIFNEISAAEISRLPTMEQLDLLDQFKVTPADLEDGDDEKFAIMERDGRKLYRFRSEEYRIYFAVEGDSVVVVYRVLHKGTFQDFLFRSKLPLNEDEALSDSKHFWQLIDEGEKARRV